MLHKFRRIFVLTLCLALVCCLSMTAFAETYDYKSFEEDYDNGQTKVFASCVLEKYRTSGGIEVIQEEVDYPETETSVTYNYLDNSYTLRTRYDYEMQSTSSSVYVSFYPYEIYHMVYADYSFWAEVPTGYGWQEFNVDSYRLYYPIA